MSTTYGPKAATRADTIRAGWHTAYVLADPDATEADRTSAVEAETAACESYRHEHGVSAYAEHEDFEAGA